MSSQIKMYKLDAVRMFLISDYYSKKIAKNNKTIGKLVYEAVLKTIPEHIMNMFTAEEADYINQTTKSGKQYNSPKYFMAVSSISLSYWTAKDIIDLVLSIMRDEDINVKPLENLSVYGIDFPSPLPVAEKHIYSVIFDEVKKKGALYESLKEYITRDKEIRTLDNKINCLFSSKDFYPETLKKEFPEAYKAYVRLFEGKNTGKVSNPKPADCDSVESIRATLLSNK